MKYIDWKYRILKMKSRIPLLKQIIESFENKLLYNYRFDKEAVKKEEVCKNCALNIDGFCSLLNESIEKNYTCDKFTEKGIKNAEKS
jgi:hypothetical protein